MGVAKRRQSELQREWPQPVLAFAVFPREHWRKIWSTNPLERLNKEIKRRARVVGIFPNEAVAIRLVGAVLADTHDEWATERGAGGHRRCAGGLASPDFMKV